MTKTPIALAATFAAGVAITLTFAFCDVPPTDSPTPDPSPTSTLLPTQSEYPTYQLPACLTEDSDNCYWDAAVRGNHQGDSFITLLGTTYYAKK